MFLSRHGRHREKRRGIILLVVLTLLTLFALLGISFVLVANSMETSARIAREAESVSQGGFTPTLSANECFKLAMAQLLYDANDDTAGAASALRGHSLARNMYGWNYAALNDKPFTGHGRLSFASALGEDDIKLLNYQFYPSDSFLRDPERVGSRATPTAPITSPHVGMAAVPYTYPDHNNFYLAQIDPNTGEVLVPSFHREYLFGRLDDTANANWTDAKGKYKTLRPTDAIHPKFPKPLGRNGDVKNLDGAPGGPDSIWIDVGSPVLTTADGRKYKMLVAPLILELDGRVNLNVVGNLMGINGPNPDQRSNQGWGPWEINPAYVLGADGNEWRNLFNGIGTTPEGYKQVPGRYDQGTSNPAVLGPPITGTRRPRAWSQVDYDGMKSDRSAAAPFALPTPGNPGAYYSFPTFTAGGTSLGYDNGGTTENNLHASLFNPFKPTDPNRLLGLDGLARILRATGSTGVLNKSELVDLLPANLGAANSNLRRYLVTTLSADLDRAAAMPYIWDPAGSNTPADAAGAAGTRLQLRQPDPMKAEFSLASQAVIPFPGIANLGSKPPLSEFNSANWAAAPAALGRINLDRPLYNYSTDAARALKDRQEFARDAFDVLRRVSGGMDPAVAAVAPYGPNSPEFRALRKLAQIAVNLVDYIDEDDASTAFRWYAAGGTNEYVYGTELPRLVLNETYVQYDNKMGSLVDVDPMDASKGKKVNTGEDYNVNVWVELLNPLPEKDTDGTVNPAHHKALLHDGTKSIYRVVLAKPDLGSNDPTKMVLRDPANTTGDPNFGSTNRTLKTLPDWGPATGMGSKPQEITPLPESNRFSSAAGAAAGFYVLGPQTTYEPNCDPGITATWTSADMTYTLKAADQDDLTKEEKPRPTILLQRLADPARPHSDTPADPTTHNPYVTIDYVETQEHADGRLSNTTGPMAVAPVAITDRTSVGRKQPYHGYTGARVAQDPMTPPANQPKHTFYRQNSKADQAALDTAPTDPTLTLPFNWLVHLDRPPISPMELLHVSGYGPHELTQQFIYGPGGAGVQANQQAAPWLDRTARLYRFFEFTTCGLRGSGIRPVPGGRIPGKINLNTVWNAEVFRALCDPQPGNLFFSPGPAPAYANVDSIFNSLLDSRSSASRAAGKPVIQPTHQAFGATVDRPFWSLALGEATGPDNLSAGPRGLDNTLLRNHPTIPGQLLLDVGASTDPAYRRKELLTKIYNHVTTRSNTFAVWMTVGFFEVVAQPANDVPKLGDEIGKAENRQVRYRMFALVDRSHLTAFDNKLTGAISAGPNQPVVLNWSGATGRVKDTDRSDREWDIPSGTFLVVEPNDPYNEETVVVQRDGSGNLTASFQRNHPTGARVICRGNPGPWKSYDPRKDTEVVPYFTLIE